MRPRPSAVAATLWIALFALVALGLVAVSFRWRFPNDMGVRLEGFRQWVLALIHGNAEPSQARLVEVAQFDARFRDHRLTTFGHILSGRMFLVLAPLQLAGPVRARFPALHRWTGRALIALAVTAGLTGLFFGIGMPFGGSAETVVIGAVATWLFISLTRGYAAIRRHDRARHREWMLRVVGACVGVSVVRVVGALADITLTPNGIRAVDAFVIALWVGWAVTFGVTEWWIRRTRPGYS